VKKKKVVEEKISLALWILKTERGKSFFSPFSHFFSIELGGNMNKDGKGTGRHNTSIITQSKGLQA